MSSPPRPGLRSCLLHHPPLVTFFVCIVTLAAALLSLAAYLNTHPATDADYTQVSTGELSTPIEEKTVASWVDPLSPLPTDWDSLLQLLSARKICPAGAGTGLRRTLNPEETANVSIPATISLSPWPASVASSSLRITASGTQLGLAGLDADTPLSVSLTSSGRPPPWCNGSRVDCFVTYCLQISGPQHLLPYSRSPPLCPVSKPSSPVLSDLYVVETEASNSSNCSSLAYIGAPYLKNVLSEADVALCVQRLNYTGLAVLIVGLLLIVMFACCFPPSKETRAQGPL